MSLAEVEAEILQPMQRIYLPPRQMDETAQREALRGYGDVLKGFSAPDLHTGWIEVVANHQTRSWPVPGVIVLAARRARKDRGEAEPQRLRNPFTGPTYAEKLAEWERVRASAMGREAVKLNVAWALKCAVLHDGKRAEQIDLREFVRARQSAAMVANKIEAGAPIWHKGRQVTFTDENAASAMRLYRNMQLQNAETEQEVMRHSAESTRIHTTG